MPKPTPESVKLPPKSLNEDRQDDAMPDINSDEQRAPPVNMGGSREAGDGVTEVDPRTGRADSNDRIPAPQFSNRK